MVTLSLPEMQSYIRWATHCRVIKLGLIADCYIANTILCQYVREDDSLLQLACILFDEIPHKDRVTWNTLISGFVNVGDLARAWMVHKSMSRCGYEADGHTFGSMLKGIAYARRFDLAQQLHSLAMKTGYQQNLYAGSALLGAYAKCGRVSDAYKVLQDMPSRNFVSWNALIAGCAQIGDSEFAFRVLNTMENDGEMPDDGTFSPLLTLLDDPNLYLSTLQLHCKILKHGLDHETAVSNALITSYSECGSLEDAKKMFDGFSGTKDLVTLNSMIAAHLLHDEQEIAINLFAKMQQSPGFEPDIYTYTTLLSACSDKQYESLGKSLHGSVIKHGLSSSVSISNAVSCMYIYLDTISMDNVLRLFHSMEEKDQVSWNTVLTGFSQTGFAEEAIKFFVLMRSLQVGIDHYSLTASLRSCSDLATLQLGQQIHSLAFKLGFELNEFVVSSLIITYSRCGVIDNALKSFEESQASSSVVWNSMIFAYAQHGQCLRAIELFFLMREREVKIDHLTFVAALTACSHGGLVDLGRHLLDSMAIEYGIAPRMEHYACAIDLYGRAGRLQEAKLLLSSMPFKPNGLVWKAMLGACRACSDIDMATQIAAYVLNVEPEEHCTYVILANMYSNFGRWNDKAFVTKLMRENRVKKAPGCSWIEVKNKIHSFRADCVSSGTSRDISMVLRALMDEVKWVDSAMRSSGLPLEGDGWRIAG